jgi:hypothetical protein
MFNFAFVVATLVCHMVLHCSHYLVHMYFTFFYKFVLVALHKNICSTLILLNRY